MNARDFNSLRYASIMSGAFRLETTAKASSRSQQSHLLLMQSASLCERHFGQLQWISAAIITLF
jgi:hypothetical protein